MSKHLSIKIYHSNKKNQNILCVYIKAYTFKFELLLTFIDTQKLELKRKFFLFISWKNNIFISSTITVI
jgi:hypothetical protein